MLYEFKLLDLMRNHTQHMDNNILVYHCDWKRIKNIIRVQMKEFYPIKNEWEYTKYFKNAKNRLFKERLGEFVGAVFTNAYKPMKNYYSKHELHDLEKQI